MKPGSVARILVIALLVALPTLATGGKDPAGTADRMQIHKLGPLLRFEMLRQDQSDRDPDQLARSPVSGLLDAVLGPAGEARIPCWIRHDGSARFPDGALVGMSGEGIASARLTLDQIDLLSRQPGVIRISEAQRTHTLLDASVAEIRADDVHNSSGAPPVYSGLTGHDVVVGIVDTGIDVDHEDFRDHLGNTRISFLWDQTAAGTPPAGFSYGREWTAAQIDAGLCTQTDTNGHGTHVAGIAAGNGSATGNGQPAWTYVGVAPRANIIVVKSTFYSTDVADGVDYIFRKASDMGLKAVVNLSLGNQYGPHDGTSDLDQAMNALAGQDRMVVAAAGNDHGSSIHAEAVVAPGDSAVIIFEVPGYAPAVGTDNDLVYIDGYYPAGSTVGVKVVSPNSHSTGVISLGQTYDQNTADGAIYLQNSNAPGVDRSLFLALYDQNADDTPAAGEWRIVLYNTSKLSASPATADFWIFHKSMSGSVRFTQGANETKIVASPATADSVIAVGAYITKTQWTSVDGNGYQYPGVMTGAISAFSSRGPRRDGVIKPNVSAPGQGIGAALSADAAWIQDQLILEDGVHRISQGTSMAAPHVAGLVALMLSQQSLHPIDAIEKLQSSSRADGNTGATPNTTWGWGKIDAVGATSIPSPILVYAVDARWESSRGVILEWEVPWDLAALRFRVYRSMYGSGAGLLGETETGPGYLFNDPAVSPEGDPEYWLEPIAGAHASGRFGPYRPVTGEAHSFVVSRPTPNPSVDYVRWQMRTPGAGQAAYEILDPAGRRIWAERLDVTGPGLHEFVWEGLTRDGRPAASGLYWIRTRWEDQSQVHKLLRVPYTKN